MYLASNIKYLRLKNGYSQDYIANKLGYKSFTTIQKWESGVSEPPIKKLQMLASLFNVDIDDLANKCLSNMNEEITHIPNYYLSTSEITHIEKYRAVDDVTKNIVDTILDKEISRPVLMAAHDDHIDEPGEKEKIMADMEMLKNLKNNRK